ncbi:MAG: beta strand repeat-containing protein [Limisphaerales bacterium]
MKRKLLSKSFLKQTALAVPAAALMLGSAQAGTTVGLNFQSWYYDSGATPQTIGYGSGYCTTGFPVTAKAFGVDATNWFNADPLPCKTAISGVATFGGVDTTFAGGLTANVTAPNAWVSGIGEQVPGWQPETVAPGNNEVTWGYLDSSASQSPAVSVSGLAAIFPNGYVIATIAAEKGVASFNDVNITDGTTKSTCAYSTYYVAGQAQDNYGYGSGTVGFSAPSSVFTNDTIDINPQAQTSPNRSTLAGFIITDEPVISQDPVGGQFAVGTAFSLSAGVIGLPSLAYQWRTNGVAIPGASSATYTNTSATAAAAGNYDVVVTNLYGAATSGVAYVSVVSSTPAFLTWNDGAANMQWDTSSLNWLNGATPAIWNSFAPDGADFGATGVGTVTLTTAISASSITFDSEGYTIDGNTLTLVGTAPSITNNADATVSSILAGANGLTQTGAGTLTLTGANTYTGPTVVNDGTLLFGPGGQLASGLGSSLTINNGATVEFSGNQNSDNIGSGSLPITVNAGGTLAVTVRCAMGYDDLGNYANITLNGGTLSLPALQYIGTITLNGGTVSGGPANLGFWYAVPTAITVTSNATIEGGIYIPNAFLATTFVAAGQTLTLGGSSEGNGSITKTGPGTLLLTGDNTYTGATIVSGGTLEATGTITGPVTIQGGGTLAVSTEVDTNAVIGALSLASTLTMNSGSTNFMRITKTGGAPASDTINGSGGTLNYGGTLVVANITSDATELALGDTFNLFPGFTYNGTFNNFILPALPGQLSWDISQLASGSITVVNTAVTPIFTPPAGDYIGAQPLTVTITSFTPGATIYYTTDGSTPTTASPHGITPVSVVVPPNTNITIQAYAHESGYSDSGVATASYATETGPAVWINPTGGSWASAGDWTNNVIPNQSGATADFSRLTLPADTFVTLDTASSSGTWTVGSLIFGDAGTNYTWEIDTGSGGTLTLDAGTNSPAITVNNETATITAVIAGTNGLTMAGAGTLALTGANTYTGPTVVNNGTMLLGPGGSLTAGLGSGLTINNGGTVQFSGDGDSDTIGGDYMPITVNAGGVLAVTVGNSMGYDYLDNYANITLNGGTFALSDVQYIGTITLNGGTVSGTGAMQFWYAVPTAITVTSNADISAPMNLNNDFLATVFVASDQTLTVSGAIQSDGSITKMGAGTLTLTDTNTYSGATTVGDGTLEVYGSLAPASTVNVAGGTLGGTGTIGGPVTINSGGTLAVDGASIGTLTITNSLTLNAGSATMLKLDKAATANDSVAGITTLTYGGTLTVTNLAGTLAAGDTFQLFNASTYSGDFGAKNLPSLSAGLAWNWTPSNGTLAVVTAAAPPMLSGFGPLSGSSFPLTFSGPSGQTYKVLMSTNVALPLASWTALTNGTFGSSPVNYTDTSATSAYRFYRIVTP